MSLSEMVALLDPPEDDDEAARLRRAREQLDNRQRQFCSDVNAEARQFARAGGVAASHRRPTSALDVGLLQLAEQRRLNNAIEGIYDLMRANVSCVPL